MYFFAKSFKKNWTDISKANLSFSIPYILYAMVFILTHYLLCTLTWRMLINGDKKGKTLNMRECVGINFMSALTKYLPGKIWSYAFQFYILTQKEFELAKVVFDNIVLLTISVTTVALIAIVYLVTVFLTVSTFVKIAILIGVIVVYLVCLTFLSNILDFFLKLASKISSKVPASYKISRKMIFQTQAGMLLANIALATAAVFLSYGISTANAFTQAVEIAVCSIISSMVGLMAIFVPGGLGVQESTLSFLLRSSFPIAAVLIFPVAFRLAILVGDAIRGTIAVFCMKTELKHFKKANK